VEDLIMALGEPSVVLHSGYAELLYVEEGLIFYLDTDTQRVWAATLIGREYLVEEYIPDLELQDWCESEANLQICR
jgi:hypothetical protein